MGNRGRLRRKWQRVDSSNDRSLSALATSLGIVCRHFEGRGRADRSRIITIRGFEEGIVVVIPFVLDIGGRSCREGHLSLAATARVADDRGGRRCVDHHLDRDCLALTSVRADGSHIIGRCGGDTGTVGILCQSRHGSIVPLGMVANIAGSGLQGHLNVGARQTLRSGSRHSRYFRNIKNRNSQ